MLFVANEVGYPVKHNIWEILVAIRFSRLKIFFGPIIMVKSPFNVIFLWNEIPTLIFTTCNFSTIEMLMVQGYAKTESYFFLSVTEVLHHFWGMKMMKNRVFFHRWFNFEHLHVHRAWTWWSQNLIRMIYNSRSITYVNFVKIRGTFFFSIHLNVPSHAHWPSQRCTFPR